MRCPPQKSCGEILMREGVLAADGQDVHRGDGSLNLQQFSSKRKFLPVDVNMKNRSTEKLLHMN